MESNVKIKPDPDSILAPGHVDCDNDKFRADETNENSSVLLHRIKEEKIDLEIDPSEFITDDGGYMFLYDTEKDKIDSESETEADEISTAEEFRVTVKQELDSCDSDHTDAEAENTNEILGAPSRLSALQESEIQRKSGDGTRKLPRKRNVEMIECRIDPMATNSNNKASDVDRCDDNRVVRSGGGTRKLPRKRNVEMIECRIDPMAINSNNEEASNVDRCDDNRGVQRSRPTRRANQKQPNRNCNNNIKLNAKVEKDRKKREPIGRSERDDAQKKRFICHICQKVCSSKFNLNLHIGVHLGDKPHQCQVCKKSFSQSGHLKRHTRGHVTGKAAARILAGEKPFECQVCKKDFTSSYALIVHSRTHTGEKPYECQVCQRAFACQSNLTVHHRVHTGEKPYKCQVCQKQFSKSSHFVVHTRIHTGEKPYKCGSCEKAFSDKSDLTVHTRYHTGERPYKCGVCERTFVQSHQLTDHSRTHARDKSYK